MSQTLTVNKECVEQAKRKKRDGQFTPTPDPIRSHFFCWLAPSHLLFRIKAVELRREVHASNGNPHLVVEGEPVVRDDEDDASLSACVFVRVQGGARYTRQNAPLPASDIHPSQTTPGR
jgi:hypothetical protein